jgi:hypothetical protein|tara:strand:- start:29332 stop:30111 length:780 start_codon:yes stop_codon:yes gene_type:complete
MSSIVNKIVKVGTLGRERDVTGIDAAGSAARGAANVQAQAAESSLIDAREQRDFERQQAGIDRQQNNERYREQFDLSQSRFDINRADNAPRIEGGNQAFSQQQALLGLSGQEAQQSAYGQIQESAGQRFLRERQQKALVRNASAIGGLGGGNVRTALQEQAAGFAMQDIDNQFNRLGSLSAQGQNAINSSGQLGTQPTTNSASNVQTNVSNASTNTIANLQANQAAARASGILGQTQAEAAATGQLLQLAGMAAGSSLG